MIPEHNIESDMYAQHVSRYVFASQFVKGKIVLDIACGSGYGSQLLLEAGAKEVIGVDVSEDAIEYCKKKYRDPKMKFVQGSVDLIPIDTEKSIDVIVSFETIEHVGDTEQKTFLQQVKKFLKSDGVFIVSTPNNTVSPQGNPFHIKEFGYSEFFTFLSQYFSSVEPFLQDSVEASYVFSKKSLEKKSLLNISQSVQLFSTRSVDAEKNLFLIAMCSSSPLPTNIHDMALLSDIQAWKRYIGYEDYISRKDVFIREKDRYIEELNGEVQKLKELLDQKNVALQSCEKDIQQKSDEIAFVTSSRFWVLRSRYMNFKQHVWGKRS